MKNQNQKKFKKINVVHFIWWIPHYRAPIFRRLSQNKNINFIVCAGDKTNTSSGAKIVSAHETGKAEGINWKCIESRRLSKPLVRGFEWQPEAVRMALKEDIDVVISFGYVSLSNILIRIICKLRGIPLIEWTQGVKREERGLRWFVRKLYFKWASAFLLYGNFAKNFFISRGFREEKIFVVYNSLDYEKQKTVREKITEKDKQACRARFGATALRDRLVFFSGRLEPGKRVHLIIEALAELKRKERRVFAVLIGEGTQKEALQRLASSLGLGERLFFYGSCYEEKELGRIISSSDLCIVPGEVGLIAMHSLVYGTPVLACDNTRRMHGPEIETVIEGRTGRFFKDGDALDLSSKIESMLYPAACKQEMSRECMKIIDRSYTPQFQEQVVVRALNYVLPADKQIPVPEEESVL